MFSSIRFNLSNAEAKLDALEEERIYHQEEIRERRGAWIETQEIFTRLHEDLKTEVREAFTRCAEPIWNYNQDLRLKEIVKVVKENFKVL